MKTYPVKFPVWPAAVSNWLSRTVQTAPEGRVPSDAKPPPGLTVALVVNENDVGAPVAGVFQNVRVSVPADLVAPPAPLPNGSDVVLATAIPVSYGANVIAYGMSSVVLAGTMLTTVTGPTSRSTNVGYAGPVSVGTLVTEVRVGSLPTPVPIGYIVAVTVIEPAVETEAVEATATV